MKKIDLRDKGTMRKIIITICITLLIAVSSVFIRQSGLIEYVMYNHHIKIAKKYLEQGKYDEAIMEFNKAIAIQEKTNKILSDVSDENSDMPPIINASNKITTVGSVVDLLSDVTARDSQNRDLSKYVTISSTNINFNEVGIYDVTYTVLDSKRMRTDKEIQVKVVDKPSDSAKNTPPILRVGDKITSVGKPVNLMVGVIANDDEDGDLTEYITVVGEVIIRK